MKIKLTLLFLLVFFGSFLTSVHAQSGYGYSLLRTYTNANQNQSIHAESGTILDYGYAYYYDPGLEATVYKNSYVFLHQDRVLAPGYTGIIRYLDTEAAFDDVFRLHTDHYVGAYRYYTTSQGPRYVDYFGLNYYSGNYPSPYGFLQGPTGYYYYRIYKVATTQVQLTIPRPPLHLASIDQTGFPPGTNLVTSLRGTGLFGSGQSVHVSGSGVTARVRPNQLPNTIEVLEIEIDIDDNAARGDRQLTLTVGGVTSNAITFRVGDNSPLITDMTPPQGNTGDNVTVTITGSHFGFNPELLVDGAGVHATILQGATTTQIRAVMSIADATYIGDRGVTVKSHGYSGNGFQQVPGTSDTSNAVDFNVTAPQPKVTYPDIGSIEKGTIKIITVLIERVPDGIETRFNFINQTEHQSTDPDKHWISGEARFDDGSENGLTEFTVTGSGNKQLMIRGWQRSSSKNNVELQATLNNGDTKKKSFTVSSVEFLEKDECTGYDGVEFKRNNTIQDRYIFVPKSGSNQVKARVIPSGATGDFKFVSSDTANFTISPATVNSTSEQVITLTANASVGRNVQITVKGNNNDASNRYAEFINPKVLTRLEKKVVMYAVTESNDDVKAIPIGQGQPNHTAYVVLNGPNGVLDTTPDGDDNLSITPYYERPPDQRNNPRLWRVLTGTDGILDTPLKGDDQMYVPGSAAQADLYNPIPIVGNGTPNATCITSGANNFLDTIDRGGDDQETVDPNNSALKVVNAGANGRCQTDNNDHDISPPSLPSVTEVQNYLNNTTWGRQANIYFTVTRGQDFTVNFDLDRDREFNEAPTPPSRISNEAAAIRNFRNDGTALNLYYFGMLIKPTISTSPRPTAYSYFPLESGWFGTQGLAKQTAAHEIGHLLGRTGPTPLDSHSPVGEDYYPDLMYPTYLPAINQCRVRNPDWSKVNN